MAVHVAIDTAVCAPLAFETAARTVANMTVPSSTIKKNMNNLSYHFIRGRCARDEWQTGHINTHLNYADLLTMSLPAGEKHMLFV